MLELLASVFIAGEEVEAGAARAQEHHVSRAGETACSLDCIFCRMSVHNVLRPNHFLKSCVDLGIVKAEAYYSLYLGPDELIEYRVIIALVLASDYPDDRLGLAFEILAG